jgi:hypothetical protein
MARPRKQIDALQVEQLAAISCPIDEIATIVGCGRHTLMRRYATELAAGRSKCRKTIRAKLFHSMNKGNIHATIFLAKAVCGMRENDPQTVVNVTQQAISITDQTKARLAELHQMIRRESLIADHNGNGS